MLWSIVWFYEAMCIAGTLTYVVVVFVKEMVHYARTNETPFEYLEDYLKYKYGIGNSGLTKHDYVEAAAKYLFAGWFYGMLALNEYYDYLEYYAERQKEKA